MSAKPRLCGCGLKACVSVEVLLGGVIDHVLELVHQAEPLAKRVLAENLKPGDKTQVLPKGTKTGLLKRGEVMADFRKIIRGKR